MLVCAVHLHPVALRLQLSAVTINPFIRQQRDTRFYFFCVTSEPKIYSVPMLSNQLSSKVNISWEI